MPGQNKGRPRYALRAEEDLCRKVRVRKEPPGLLDQGVLCGQRGKPTPPGSAKSNSSWGSLTLENRGTPRLFGRSRVTTGEISTYVSASSTSGAPSVSRARERGSGC